MAASEAAVTAVREVLVLHPSDGFISSRDQWVGCTCGERLPCRIEDGYPVDEDEEHRVRAAHVAVAAADAAVDADRASIQAEAIRTVSRCVSPIEALHPGETKNSVIWLRGRADRIEGKP